MSKTKEVEAVNPEHQLAQYEPLYTRLTGWATLKVVDERSKTEALEAIRGLEELQDKYKAFRDSLVSDTIKKMQKLVQSREKIIKDIVGDWSKGLRGQLSGYETAQSEIRRKEEERLQAEQAKKYAKAVAKADSKGSVPPPPPPPVAVIAPKEDGVSFSTKAVFEIIDINLVPREYLCLNEKMVNKIINAGIKEIAGLRISNIKTARIGESKEEDI